MQKNIIKLLIIIAALAVLAALAYAVYYFIVSDPRVAV